MPDVNSILLAGGTMVLAAILLGSVSARMGLPVLLVFLVVGMLAGEDGPGGIVFNDVRVAFLVGNLALAIILLDGGLRTRYETFRVGLRPALVLATVGVALTAALLGSFAAWLLELDWRLGLLLGAVVGSTDAAAVFAILRGSGAALNDRLSATLEIESGANDPMAVFLTITLIGVLAGTETVSVTSFLESFAKQFGGGLAGGLLLGHALHWVLARVQLSEGLYALLIASGGVLAFAAVNAAGGSGFLTVYLIGLVVGNKRVHADENVLRAMDGLAWLAQAGMFLLLGLLVTPRELPAIAWPAFLIALVLMLIARPVATVACLAPFRFAPRETAFVSWVGLRGAVPVILALFPLMAGIEGARVIFNIAFFVVLMSLLVQGSSVAWVARRLGVVVPPRTEPIERSVLAATRDGGWELVQFDLGPQSRAAGERLDALRLPEGARAIALFRAGTELDPEPSLTLMPGDRVALFAPSRSLEAVAAALADVAPTGPLAPQAFFGEFDVAGTTPIADLADLYGLDINPALRASTLEALFAERLGRRAVVGDRLLLGALRVTVREVRHGRVTQVGLKLPRAQAERDGVRR
jgi:cell volume regulation protein A